MNRTSLGVLNLLFQGNFFLIVEKSVPVGFSNMNCIAVIEFDFVKYMILDNSSPLAPTNPDQRPLVDPQHHPLQPQDSLRRDFAKEECHWGHWGAAQPSQEIPDSRGRGIKVTI